MRVESSPARLANYNSHRAVSNSHTLYAHAIGQAFDLFVIISLFFRPVRNRSTSAGLDKPLNPQPVYSGVVRGYATQVGITVDTHGFCTYSHRGTVATNALENGANIGRV